VSEVEFEQQAKRIEESFGSFTKQIYDLKRGLLD
jgi:hypothetical protein